MASECPYRSLPDHAYWRRSVAEVPAAEVDPILSAPFKVARTDRVATAGSCFAQHVARYLAKGGFTYFVPERAPPFFNEALAHKFGYGVFSARFGNIYTTRQLVQLFDRAFGDFSPAEDCWPDPSGGVLDPFRPTIQPKPFISEAELREDRRHHLAFVRQMFIELDVFVFTLGLTETWVSSEDRAVFPICPGCGGGTFDPARHKFVNLGVAEVEADLEAFLERLKGLNPRARVVLTVSPVPLIATMSGHHVLAATTYSKSVLRVAAETIRNRHDHVAYFPSFEVITGAHAQGAYYASDLRNVREDGVAHAMRLFFKHFADGEAPLSVPAAAAESASEKPARHAPRAKTVREPDIVDVVCEEIVLEQAF
jgi:hypothetical protein